MKNKISLKNPFLIIFLSCTVACAQQETETEQGLATPYDPSIPVLEVSMYNTIYDLDIIQNHPYDSDFTIEKAKDGEYSLITSIKLYGGSFFISPASETDFKGKFRIEVTPNDNLTIATDLIETPATVTVIDPHRFVNGPVNWVTKDTKYKHALQLNTEEDFMVRGTLTFVIEPKCTLEEVPIMFRYKDGVLTVES
jgi:hypothetical protein